jgi:hypothetical protein
MHTPEVLEQCVVHAQARGSVCGLTQQTSRQTVVNGKGTYAQSIELARTRNAMMQVSPSLRITPVKVAKKEGAAPPPRPA